MNTDDFRCDNCHLPFQPDMYYTYTGILCKNCVSSCIDCNTGILYTRDYCHDCEQRRLLLRKKLLYRTTNNITKILPVELVNEIMNFLVL
jgi:recombinational DNA repair protein (RecF pathway)